ncbi:hypothetical protein R4488_04310 [Acinetobacter baumannii]|uniref:hypothetical protein n=1 Tax=Acinetobacter baumannii TaxID=470 RepID=UPI0003DFAF31|nr:hypothetical protein [Acinetobacter baumannii]ETQ99597.1 hypothetical protein P673_0033 [Acinetobacter baumannii UH6507]MDC4591816.1 hypothetical protein [Acinetobacter baumannii]MDV7439174.1 hypothetical protein [Acinetobacter baumannii]MDV7449307.1 hypothetical protein [Acinetobacter baumannii]
MNSFELKVLIPLMAPFITVFLGILTIPFIEDIKNYNERKRLLKVLEEELKDEVKIILNEFYALYPCYIEILSVKNGVKASKYNTVTPINLVLFSIDPLLNNHFHTLEPNLRLSIKNIKSLFEHLNIVTGQLHELYHDALQKDGEDNLKLGKLLDLLNSYLCNLLSLRYHMYYLINLLTQKPSDLKIYYEVSFEDSILHQLKELDKIDYYSYLIN